MIFFFFFSSSIISIFTDDVNVHRFGTLALQVIGSGYIFYGISMVMIQALNGAGDSKTPTWINLAGFWFFQIPLSYILSETFNQGPLGAFISVPVAETAIAIAGWYFFKKGKWKNIKV